MILDATCGGRMMWFQKDHEDVVYCDRRIEPNGTIPDRPNFNVLPDVVADFRGDLPFRDSEFDMVVFDPPQRANACLFTITAKKFGSLDPQGWEDDLHRGFVECFRVLRPGGFLIFKWSEVSFKVSDVLKLCPVDPMFGHTTGKNGGTKWICFRKNISKQQAPRRDHERTA